MESSEVHSRRHLAVLLYLNIAKKAVETRNHIVTGTSSTWFIRGRFGGVYAVLSVFRLSKYLCTD